MSDELLEKVERIIKIKPRSKMNEYYEFLSFIRVIVQAKSDLLISEMIVKIGLSQTQFYQRVRNPDLWKKSEVEKIMKLLGI